MLFRSIDFFTHISFVPVEDIVVEELKKAYVRKEINYMFNGDDAEIGRASCRERV